ncbi:hypothetical protein AAF712_016795 [Marasmius tenuissimus]|uniref:Uncharacterized protein n=1 Tax=Marasmius tenuissimus TaxID=585030 RepID=A0ABR2Z506_9AGAR
MQLGDNQSLAKADEWRRLIGIAPVLLWVTWRQGQDRIPDTEPPLAANKKIKTTCSRKRFSLYSACLLLCVSVRLFATRTISMRQAETAQDFMSQYCCACIRLGISLVVNHHLSEHFSKMIKRFGPLYGWWLFGFERFNGMLEKVNINGKDKGRSELTLLRNWVQTHLIYELLISLPPDAHILERQLVEEIIETEGRERGGMMTQIAMFRSEADTDSVKLPKRFARNPQDINGQDPSGRLYRALLVYLQNLWPDLDLIPELSMQPGHPFVSKNSAHFLPYIRKDGLRYGSHTSPRTQADSFALVLDNGVRVPVRIEYLILVRLQGSNKPPHVCIAVRRLVTDNSIPPMPWDRYADILGINVSYAGKLDPLAIISASSIEAPVALIPVFSNVIQQELWITISFDHVRTHQQEIHEAEASLQDTSEPEVFGDNDDW